MTHRPQGTRYATISLHCSHFHPKPHKKYKKKAVRCWGHLAPKCTMCDKKFGNLYNMSHMYNVHWKGFRKYHYSPSGFPHMQHCAFSCACSCTTPPCGSTHRCGDTSRDSTAFRSHMNATHTPEGCPETGPDPRSPDPRGYAASPIFKSRKTTAFGLCGHH